MNNGNYAEIKVLPQSVCPELNVTLFQDLGRWPYKRMPRVKEGVAF